MKALIVASKSLLSGESEDYQYLFPLGLAYICSVVKKAGHEVEVLNLNHQEGSIDLLVARAIDTGRFDVVLAGGLSTAYLQIKRIADAVKASGFNAKLIIGGGIVSSEPELMFEALEADYVVLGEGEETIVELLACIEKNVSPEAVPGLGFRNSEGKFVKTETRKPIMDLDAVPWPDFEAFGFGKYLDHMKPTDQNAYDVFDRPRVYPIVTSRSCPYLCSFCFHPLGNKYRQRSMDSIMEELDVMVRRYDINIIAIYDELFAQNAERVYEFCRRVSKLSSDIGRELKWGCQMRVDRLDSDLLAAMRSAGCYAISYGFESFSPVVLESMKKHIKPEQIDRAIKMTLENRISIQANFIFGDRAETAETARETLEYWKKNAHAGIVLAFINPYPGTKLYAHCIEKGLIKDRLDFIANHIFDPINMSESMTGDEFIDLQIEKTEAELSRYITALPSKVEQSSDGTYSLTVRCPHCSSEIDYGNYVLPSAGFFNVMTYCRNCRRRFFMVTGSYRLAMKTVSAGLSLLPRFVKRFMFRALASLKPVIIKKLTSGSGNMSKIKKMLFP